MKKSISILVAFLMIVSVVNVVTAASANNVPTFKVDGKLFITPKGEPEPYINKDNRTMGSLRLIANALGVDSKNIKWNNTAQVATLTRGDNTVSVTVGKKVITVNGKSVTMDTVAEMKQGRVFIPARYIGEGLGVTVKFESATNTVHFLTGTEFVDVNDNFESYGLKRVEHLPITLQTKDGLKWTIHSAYMYKTDSAEAKELHKKYNFVRFNERDYIIWLEFTVENTGNRVIQYNHHDPNPKLIAVNGKGKDFEPALANKEEYLGVNNKGYFNYFRLEVGDKVKHNMGYMVNKSDLDEIIFGASTNNGNDFKIIVKG